MNRILWSKHTDHIKILVTKFMEPLEAEFYMIETGIFRGPDR